MKALTITQPWAEAISRGWKTIETRSWGTLHRGPLAIHAAKAMSDDEMDFAQERGLRINDLARGMVVATCELVDCRRIVAVSAGPFLDDDEAAWGNFEQGRYMWLLENVRILPMPVPARGRLGLWDWREAA